MLVSDSSQPPLASDDATVTSVGVTFSFRIAC